MSSCRCLVSLRPRAGLDLSGIMLVAGADSSSSILSSYGVQGWLQGCAVHANFARCFAIGCGVSLVDRNDAGDGIDAGTAIIYWRCV